jgi:hypothetical protein
LDLPCKSKFEGDGGGGGDRDGNGEKDRKTGRMKGSANAEEGNLNPGCAAGSGIFFLFVSFGVLRPETFKLAVDSSWSESESLAGPGHRSLALFFFCKGFGRKELVAWDIYPKSDGALQQISRPSCLFVRKHCTRLVRSR